MFLVTLLWRRRRRFLCKSQTVGKPKKGGYVSWTWRSNPGHEDVHRFSSRASADSHLDWWMEKNPGGFSTAHVAQLSGAWRK